VSRKLLIVDDEPHIRALVEQALEDLEDLGIEFLSADNGEDALRLIVDEQPELVVLDVMMPKMNGYDVCRAVRSEGLDQVRIILLTAKGQELDRSLGQEVGADVYTTKPFDPDELLELSRRFLGFDGGEG
jgi:two-component system, OmpR family, alkaline phosphatase synthesis response regulator PhoP